MSRKPKQNRVSPDGGIHAVPSRGLFMGNRGVLHDDRGRVNVARWRHKAWIVCVLEFRGRRRRIMQPRRYTELFFLDEAVALAAGHRPCAECRRDAYRAYRSAVELKGGLAASTSAAKLDAVLHRERVDSGTRAQVTRQAVLESLPRGVMVSPTASPATAPCLWDGAMLRRWSFGGYGHPEQVDTSQTVSVLTPPTSLKALSAGYRPILHPTYLALAKPTD